MSSGFVTASSKCLQSMVAIGLWMHLIQSTLFWGKSSLLFYSVWQETGRIKECKENKVLKPNLILWSFCWKEFNMSFLLFNQRQEWIDTPAKVWYTLGFTFLSVRWILVICCWKEFFIDWFHELCSFIHPGNKFFPWKVPSFAGIKHKGSSALLVQLGQAHPQVSRYLLWSETQNQLHLTHINSFGSKHFHEFWVSGWWNFYIPFLFIGVLWNLTKLFSEPWWICTRCCFFGGLCFRNNLVTSLSTVLNVSNLCALPNEPKLLDWLPMIF